MDKDELIAAFKGDLADELGAINKYSGQLEHVADPEMRRKLEEIRDEEKVHAGEFGDMLDQLDAPYDPAIFEQEVSGGTFGQTPQGTEAISEDHSEVAHWISGLGGGPGIVSDPGQARSQPCIRYELGAGHAPLVFQKGIIGPLDEDQTAEFCAMGFEDVHPTERQAERLRVLPEAAQTCSLEVKDVPRDKHIDAYYNCLEAELRKRGV